MYVIAGLGNPGREYEGTRHNVGFMTLDALADKYNIDVREKAFIETHRFTEIITKASCRLSAAR